MKLTIDAEMCTGHGRCYTLAPDLLSYDDEGFVTERGATDRGARRAGGGRSRGGDELPRGGDPDRWLKRPRRAAVTYVEVAPGAARRGARLAAPRGVPPRARPRPRRASSACCSSRTARPTSPTSCASASTELVVRRPPFGRLAPGAHDMRREFRAVDALSRHFDRAPHAYAFCDDHDVIGSDFLVVEYRHGVVVWDHVPESMAGHERRRAAHRLRRRRRPRRPPPARPRRRRARRPRPARRVRRAAGVGLAQAVGPRRHRAGPADGRRRRSPRRHHARRARRRPRSCTTTTRSTTASSTRSTPIG